MQSNINARSKRGGEASIFALQSGMPSQESKTSFKSKGRGSRIHFLTLNYMKSGDMFDDPLLLLPMAKLVLERDGMHVPTAWLRHADGRVGMLTLKIDDRTGKYPVEERLTGKVRQPDVDAVVWLHSADKMEGLFLGVAKKNGECTSHLVMFERKNGKVEFQPSEEQLGKTPDFLNPILEAWRGRQNGR